MKLTNDMIAKIQEVAEEAFYDYEVVAVRVQDVPFELGAIDHVSHVWIDGEETDEELSGICGTSSDLLTGAPEYCGEHIAIIAGNEYEYGEDFGEVIIRDAQVIEILK